MERERFCPIDGCSYSLRPRRILADGLLPARRPRMKKQFAPLLLTILLTAALRAPGQTPDNTTGLPGSSVYPQTQSGSVDCTDPLEADSAQCAFQTQGTNPYGNQYGYPPRNSMAPGMPGMPSTGLPGPQTQNPGYLDNG